MMHGTTSLKKTLFTYSIEYKIDLSLRTAFQMLILYTVSDFSLLERSLRASKSALVMEGVPRKVNNESTFMNEHGCLLNK